MQDSPSSQTTPAGSNTHDAGGCAPPVVIDQTPVDVLAVVALAERTMNQLDLGESADQRIDALRQARAAVTAFIREACRLRRTYDLGETTFADRKEALSRFDAALARIGGGQ